MFSDGFLQDIKCAQISHEIPKKELEMNFKSIIT